MLWFDEIKPVLAIRDFVEGLLVEGTGAVVYGKSNAGKTFWVTDLALHIAALPTWNGREVEKGGVIYVIMEGEIGFMNRVAAWQAAHQVTGIPFAVVRSHVNMLDPHADIERLVASIKAAAERISMPVKLVVIDTLARALSGRNENASEDMGALVKGMDRVRSQTGACVLFIHHCGKDEAKGSRGHSCLVAAIDTEIEVACDDDGNRTATVTKQRDFAKGDVFRFRLKPVEVGINQRQKPVTTCLVEHDTDLDSGSMAKKPKITLSGNAKRAKQMLLDVIAQEGEPLPSLNGYPTAPDLRCVPIERWQAECEARRLSSANQKCHHTEAFTRAFQTLLDAEAVASRDDVVWLP